MIITYYGPTVTTATAAATRGSGERQSERNLSGLLAVQAFQRRAGRRALHADKRLAPSEVATQVVCDAQRGQGRDSIRSEVERSLIAHGSGNHRARR